MRDIQIISAPSILGLRPTGVEELGKSLLNNGLAEKIRSSRTVTQVPDLNVLYEEKRDPETNCLNAKSLRNFSLRLNEVVSATIDNGYFAFVLGGDCSILLGIMPALKAKGTYGLIFLDAHADFYQPEKSITGEVADMDLAIVTGRGPELLTNINDQRPYVKDENVIHIGQRDQDETKKYGSFDIRETGIKCFALDEIEEKGIAEFTTEVLKLIETSQVDGFWIHFDTDVLSDDINPAVDYRLPGGLLFEQVEKLLGNLLSTGKMRGISITIFNPRLDNGSISKNITESLQRIFAPS